MRDCVAALGKNVGADSRLIVQQSTFVRIGGRCIHAGAEVDEDSCITVSTLDDNRRGIRAETRGMNEIFRGEYADLRGPLERGECLVEWQSHRVVVGDETRRFTGAQEEMRERVGAIFKCPHNAGGFGRGHLRIITEQEFNC